MAKNKVPALLLAGFLLVVAYIAINIIQSLPTTNGDVLSKNNTVEIRLAIDTGTAQNNK